MPEIRSTTDEFRERRQELMEDLRQLPIMYELYYPDGSSITAVRLFVNVSHRTELGDDFVWQSLELDPPTTATN